MPSSFYEQLCGREEYQLEELQRCIENTVDKLKRTDTSQNRPGMLLGKIQSGKTRTFIGVIAKAFDEEYDLAIILTKGTKALAQQTYQRMKKEFGYFVDQVLFFDIMSNFPAGLTKYECKQKIILVVKKQKDNLSRLEKALFQDNPELGQKKTIIIDDEADFASIGFVKKAEEQIEIKKIAGQIDDLRKRLAHSSFLQVTATPYSLYLQPDELVVGNETFRPVKPAFTELAPIAESYVGGNYYFYYADDDEGVAKHIYVEIPADELRIMRKSDRRSFKIEEALTSKSILFLRQAIVNFVVGGCIRRLMDRRNGYYEKKFSFIVHTEMNRAAHEWQEEIVRAIGAQLAKAAVQEDDIFKMLVREAYDSLSKSAQAQKMTMPTFQNVLEETKLALAEEYLMVTRVNSDKDVNELLDDSGQLKLRTPLNIYIGGQILDRGITIGNLIGFYYGRSPNKFQQDTVLQHSRMFGHRPVEDLPMTRFYTTRGIYEAMKRIEDFDSALRDAFESGAHDRGVIFIQRDASNKIIPCSPNKILVSSTTTLKPSQRLLPIGFQTGYKTNISKTVNAIDSEVLAYLSDPHASGAFRVPLEAAVQIIGLIKDTLEFDDDYEWDSNAFVSSMEYLSKNSCNKDDAGKVLLVVRRDRDIRRIREGGRVENSPDTGRQKVGETRIAREAAIDIPALILLRQNGKTEFGWRGTPFWWPILVTPQNMKPMVFASKAMDFE